MMSCVRVLSLYSPEVTEEDHKNRLFSVLANILTWWLPNTSQKQTFFFYM
jgi:hypothetical protein